MSGTLIDTNVLIDVFRTDSEWRQWSLDQLDMSREHGKLYVNQVVYSEFAAGPAPRDALDNFFSATSIERLNIPWEAAFLAGQAFARYRARGGSGDRLADFLIGAHAQVAGMRLLTRDARRYRGSFDALELVAPGADAP